MRAGAAHSGARQAGAGIGGSGGVGGAVGGAGAAARGGPGAGPDAGSFLRISPNPSPWIHGVPVPLAGGVASAQLGRHETENLRTPLLYAPPRLPRPFEAIKYVFFAAIARN